MKKLILIAILALGVQSCGIPKYLNTGTIEVQREVVENNKNALDNYVLANEWMVEAFNNAESVIQFSDKEAGIVKGKYSLYSGYTSGYYTVDPVSAIITVRTKDGSATLSIDTRGNNFQILKYTDVNLQAHNKGISSEDAKLQINLLIESFKNRLKH